MLASDAISAGDAHGSLSRCPGIQSSCRTIDSAFFRSNIIRAVSSDSPIGGLLNARRLVGLVDVRVKITVEIPLTPTRQLAARESRLADQSRAPFTDQFLNGQS